MTKLSTHSTAVVAALALTVLAAAPAAVAQSTITCGPLDNGRVADVFYKSNAVFFDPVVEYEYELAVLTISGPCETLTKTFKPGEEIFFDIREVERTLDGQYEWELRFMPAVDSGVRKELQASRGSGEEDDLWWSYWQKGAIPDGPSVDSAGFMVAEGSILDPGSDEERQKSATVATKSASTPLAAATAGFDASGGTSSQEDSGSGEGGNVLATKDTVLTNADGTIRNSLCVGFDCLNDNTYSDSTILLTENNTRIKFDDTSTSGSFPRRDWEIQANSNANGGGSWLAINDCGESSGGGCADDPVFLVEANSPANSIRVDSSGRVGFGTANPIVELHSTSGDTPTLRLDQNTSQGFASQVWDIAGNETSFFVRDASNGSTLPFRIRPGASSNSLVIDSDNDVGVGTLSPGAPLHIVRNGVVRYRLGNTDAGTEWDANNDGSGDFSISLVGTGKNEFEIEQNGDVGLGCTNPDHDLVISGGPGCTSTPRSWIDAGSTSFSTSSSRSVKENIAPVQVEGILDKVRRIPVYEYDFIGGPQDRIGLIAEEFHQVFNRGSEEELSGHEMQLALWLAVQELTDRTDEVQEKNREIESLEARLAELESVVAELAGLRAES